MAAPLVGKRVQITGLSARPDLNGKIGIAESYNHDTDRYVVSLPSNETVALRPGRIVEVATRNEENVYGGYGGARFAGVGTDPKLYFVGGLAVLVGVGGVSLLPALVLVGVAYVMYTSQAGGRGTFIENVALQLHQATGIMVTAPQLIGSAVGFLVLVWYFLSSTSGHHHPHYGDDYGFGGGFGGGGMNFYWMMSCVFLGSTVWRMGGGGRPEGWSFDQLWHALSNMDIWRGMMLLNLVTQVFGGGRGRGGGGFGRRRMW